MKVKDFNIQQWQDCLTKFLATCKEKDPPPAIRIENTQFTTARRYGGMTCNGKKYTYFEPVIPGEKPNPDGSPYVAWLMVREDFLRFATKETKAMELAQRFFELVWNQIEESTDFIYEELDPEGDYGDELCKLFNNDTILEVLRIGFRQKFGQDLKCGKLTSEIEREAKEKASEKTEPPEIPITLDVCPKCGADAAVFVHPAFDGGSYVRCNKCMYSDQAVTWAPTDAQAAQKWNNFCEKGKAK